MIEKLSLRRLLQQKFQIAGQSFALGAQPRHSYFVENIHRGAQRCHGQNRRIAQLPAFGAGDGLKLRPHLEALRLCHVPHQPANRGRFRYARDVRGRSIRRRSRGRHSDICSCTRRRNPRPNRGASAEDFRRRGPCRSRRRNPWACAGFSDACTVEGLAAVVVHSAEQDQRDPLAFFRDQRFDVFGANRRSRRARSDFDQRIRWIVAVELICDCTAY